MKILGLGRSGLLSRLYIQVPRYCRTCTVASYSTGKESPKSGWVPGDPSQTPFGADVKHICIDPSQEKKVYSLMISSTTPRPVALVSSLSKEGITNVAPFSYFGVVSHDPPMISVSFCTKRDGVKKDSLVNIEETGEFVVNMVSEWLVEAASHCAGEFDADVDEMALAGLTPLPSQVVKAPRVQESAVHYECKLTSKQEICNDSGAHTTTLVIARVERIHVMQPLLKGVANNYSVDAEGYQSLGRLGGNTWTKLGHKFDIERPKQEK